jgi:hypothetical protein
MNNDEKYIYQLMGAEYELVLVTPEEAEVLSLLGMLDFMLTEAAKESIRQTEIKFLENCLKLN